MWVRLDDLEDDPQSASTRQEAMAALEAKLGRQAPTSNVPTLTVPVDALSDAPAAPQAPRLKTITVPATELSDEPPLPVRPMAKSPMFEDIQQEAGWSSPTLAQKRKLAPAVGGGGFQMRQPKVPGLPEEPKPLSLKEALDDPDFGETMAGISLRVAKQFISGVASIAEGLGGTARWVAPKLGDPTSNMVPGLLARTGEGLTAAGKSVQEAMANPARLSQDVIQHPEMLANGEWWAAQVGQGAGSMLGFLIPSIAVTSAVDKVQRLAKVASFMRGIVPRLFGAVAGSTVESAVEAGLVFNTVYEDSKGDVAKASAAAGKTFDANIVLNTALASAGYVLPKVANWGKVAEAAGGALGEGTQETAQQLISNYNSGKRGKDLLEGVGESAIIGLLMGGSVGTMETRTARGYMTPSDVQKSGGPAGQVPPAPPVVPPSGAPAAAGPPPFVPPPVAPAPQGPTPGAPPVGAAPTPVAPVPVAPAPVPVAPPPVVTLGQAAGIAPPVAPVAPQDVAPAPTPQPPSAAPVAPQAPAAPAAGPVSSETDTLPRELAGATPRYNYGNAAFVPQFASDIDKAAFITAQTKRSARDADYLQFVMDRTGLDEDGVRALGDQVRSTIKGLAKNAESGPLTIPTVWVPSPSLAALKAAMSGEKVAPTAQPPASPVTPPEPPPVAATAPSVPTPAGKVKLTKEEYLAQMQAKFEAKKQEQAVAPAPLAEVAPQVDTKKEPIAQATTAAWKRTPIGKNKEGVDIYEDPRGVRSYLENGFRISEAVRMVPTRSGVKAETPTNRGSWAVVDEKVSGKALTAPVTTALTTAKPLAKGPEQFRGEYQQGGIERLGLPVDHPVRRYLESYLAWVNDTSDSATPSPAAPTKLSDADRKKLDEGRLIIDAMVSPAGGSALAESKPITALSDAELDAEFIRANEGKGRFTVPEIGNETMRRYKARPESAQAPAPKQLAPAVGVWLKGIHGDFRTNEQGNYEIRFPGKPNSDTLTALKQGKWRWAKTSKVWYHPATDEAQALAWIETGVDTIRPESTMPTEEEMARDEGELSPDETDGADADEENDEAMGMAGRRPRNRMEPLPQRQAPAVAPKSQMGREDILKRFQAFFASVPMNKGRFRQRAVGIYKPDVQAIRTRVSQDLQVILHELGHHVDKAVMKLRPPSGGGKFSLVSKELEALGEATTPPGRMKDRVYKRKEGAAEYLRLWFTEPDVATAKAPLFTARFEDYLNTSQELGSFFRDQQRQIQGLLAMTPQQELDERIDWNGEPGKLEQFKEWATGTTTDPRTGFQRMNDALNDDMLPILRMEKTLKEGMPVGDWLASAYAAFRLVGTSLQAKTFLEDGIRRPDLTIMGPGLFEAVKDVWNAKDYKAFVQFLTARRAQEYHEQGLESGIRPASVDAIVAAAPPKYVDAAEKVTKFWDTLLQWAVLRGYLSADTADAIRKRNTRYVPFERVMEAVAGAFGGKKQNTPQAIKARTGSARRIVDPLVTSIKNTFTFVRTVEENASRLKLVDLADKEGGAQFLERVSMKQIATRFNLDRVRSAIIDVLASNGVEVGRDLPNDINFDATVTVFTPAIIAMGDSRIVTVLRKGEREWYEVHDDALWDLLVSTQPSAVKNVVAKVAIGAASLLRRTATSTLSFVNRNLIRDTIDAKTKAQYHHTFLKSLSAAGLIIKNDDSYQRFKASKAAQASIVAVDRDYARNEIKRMQHGKLRRMLDHTVFNPFEGLRALAELSDNATRLQSFVETEKRLAKKGITGEAAAIEAAFTSRESTQDFAKMGSMIRQYNKYEAFLGARVGGYTRIATELGDPKKRNAYMTKAFVYGVLPGLLLWAINKDDEEYDQLPAWERATYWHVPNGMGGWIRLPRPFDVGDVGNMLEAYLDWAVTNDPDAIQRLPWGNGSKQDLLKLFMGMSPTAVLPWVEAMANYDTFRKRPIISPFDLDLPIDQQYSQWTSGFSRLVGPAIGLAPAMLDHIIYGYTSATGQFVSDVAGTLETAITGGPAAPSQGLRGVPGVSAFVGQKATSQASSLEKFRRDKQTLELYQRGVSRAKREGGATAQAERQAEHPTAHADLARLNFYDKQIRAVTKNLSAIRQRTDMNATEKRELYDRFYEVVIDLARQANREKPLPRRFGQIDPTLAERVPFGVRHWLNGPTRTAPLAAKQ